MRDLLTCASSSALRVLCCLMVLFAAIPILPGQTVIATYVQRVERQDLCVKLEITHFQDRSSVLSASREGTASEIYADTSEIYGGMKPEGYLSFHHSIISNASDEKTTETLWEKVDTYTLRYLSYCPTPREETIYKIHDAAIHEDTLFVLGGLGTGGELRSVNLRTGEEKERLMCRIPSFSRYRESQLEVQGGSVYVLTEVEGAKDKWHARFFTLDPATGESVEIPAEQAPEGLRGRVGKGRAFSQMPPYGEILERAMQDASHLGEPGGDKK